MFQNIKSVITINLSCCSKTIVYGFPNRVSVLQRALLSARGPRCRPLQTLVLGEQNVHSGEKHLG